MDALQWIDGFELDAPFSAGYMEKALMHSRANSGKFNNLTQVFVQTAGEEYPEATLLGLIKEENGLGLYKASMIFPAPLPVHEQYETLGDYGGVIDRMLAKIENNDASKTLKELSSLAEEKYGSGGSYRVAVFDDLGHGEFRGEDMNLIVRLIEMRRISGKKQ
ncbi:TPA: hypothetical protein HA239_06145 [Candidatus Woesearchaeota archaeon]|nr:hypothetical protein QT06_C0001G1329 [archaeon GW2011_AR15]MBS3104214.1 hypothetical protein [Candidatus Woesearchaeota archaeon]HIH41956.1 hypothetical protein [Candidatus Woesearchaeota archaeon]